VSLPASFGGKVVTAATFVGITAAMLIVADLVCNLFGIFPPAYEYGDLDVGWLTSTRAVNVRYDRCIESSGKVVQYVRNEDGIRTDFSVPQLLADRGSFKVGATGD